jgi:hypothetical protein
VDLIQIAESVAKSPFGLPLFLMAVVYYTAMVIKQKDLYMETHIKDDLEKSEERERWYRSCLEWYQKYLETNTELMANVGNDVKDIEAILREGRTHFERQESSRDDETTSDPTHDDGGLNHLRRKLSNRGKAK